MDEEIVSFEFEIKCESVDKNFRPKLSAVKGLLSL